jgi:hypothetical protein
VFEILDKKNAMQLLVSDVTNEQKTHEAALHDVIYSALRLP